MTKSYIDKPIDDIIVGGTYKSGSFTGHWITLD
jgi:hypothetical protein